MRVEVERGIFIELPDTLEHGRRLSIDDRQYTVLVGMDEETKDIQIEFLNLDAKNTQKNPHREFMRDVVHKGAGFNRPYRDRGY